jgi:hypothetical protein
VPPICNANAKITCPHQSGMVQIIPRQFQVMIGGAPALTIADMSGQPVMPGCTNLPTPGTPTFVPCAVITAPATMGSTKVKIKGVPVLMQSSLMTTNCVVPVPNGASVKSAGQMKVIATA